jgi:hypothetical protein
MNNAESGHSHPPLARVNVAGLSEMVMPGTVPVPVYVTERLAMLVSVRLTIMLPLRPETMREGELRLLGLQLSAVQAAQSDTER